MKNESKEQKEGFFGMLLGALAASVLRNMLAGKPKIPGRGVVRASEEAIKVGEETIRAGEDF